MMTLHKINRITMGGLCNVLSKKGGNHRMPGHCTHMAKTFNERFDL